MDFNYKHSISKVLVLLAIAVNISDNLSVTVKTPFCTYYFDNQQYAIRCANIPLTASRDVVYVECKPYCKHPLTKFEVIDSKWKNVYAKTFNSIRFDLVTLNLSRNEMTKLDRSAVTYLNKLTTLDVSHNELTDIDVLENSSIKYLNLSNNLLKDSELAKIRNHTNLVNLDISANLITNMGSSLLRVDSLQTLLLDHNEIAHINATNFEGIPHLKNIGLANNSIEVIDCATFEDLTELERIDLSYNLINNITKSNISTECVYKIKIVDLSHNNISKIETGIFNNNLEDLNLSNNNINLCLSSDMLKGATYLQKLNLSFNNISVIEDNTFDSITNLFSLDLSGNKLKQMNYIFNLKRLHTLNLSSNHIAAITAGVFSSSIYDLDLSYNHINVNLKMDIFSGLKKLGILNMSFNNISVIHDYAFKHNEILHELDFTGNSLTRVNFTNDLRELSRLNLAQNSIHTFVHENVNNTLKWLDLRENKLSKIDISSMKTLNTIEIRRNNLSSLDYAIYCQNGLRNISINENQIGDLKFHGICTGLEFLNVSTNKITNISIIQENQMTSLQWLDFSKNNLTNIKSTVFSQTLLLKFINLSKNMITTISPETFANLSSLLHLDLSHNRLMSLPYGLLTKCLSLQYIDVSSNKLKEFNLHVIFPMRNIHRLYLDGNQIHILNLIELSHYLKDKRMNTEHDYEDGYILHKPIVLAEKLSVYVSAGNNNFDCRWLSEVYHALDKDKIIKIESSVRSWEEDNVEGISCISEEKNSTEKGEFQQNLVDGLTKFGEQITEFQSNRSILITVLIVNICLLMLYVFVNRQKFDISGYFYRNVYNATIENEDSVELI